MKKQGCLCPRPTTVSHGLSLVKMLTIVVAALTFLCVNTQMSYGQASYGASARTQSADLLQRARQAISEGKLADAETLIQQAEGMNVQYETLYTGDTPARLRRELERVKGQTSQSQDPFALRAQSSVPAAAPVASGQMNNVAAMAKKYLAQGRQALNSGNIAQAETFCGEAMKLKVAYASGEDTPDRLMRDIQMAKQPVMPAGNAVASLPPLPPAPAAQTAPVAPAMATQPVVDVPAEVRRTSDRLLLSARLALATGDVAKANAAVAQARALNVPYGVKNDSPAKVANDIQSYAVAADAVQKQPTEGNRKEFARVLLSQANTLYQLRSFDAAESLAVSAQRQNVQYTDYDRKPEDVLRKISVARQALAARSAGSGVQMVAHNQANSANNRVSNAGYQSNLDMTNIRQVSAIQPGQPGASDVTSEGMKFFTEGENALKAGNSDAAKAAFLKAAQYRDQLDYNAQRQLNDRLTLLNVSNAPVPAAGTPAAAAAEVTAEQNALYSKVSSDLVAQEAKARNLKKTNPQEAVAVLTAAREAVDKADLDDARKSRLISRVDEKISELNAYIAQNGTVIANDERNRQITLDNQRAVQVNNEKEQKIAKLIDEFSQLTREQRFAEAELKAKQAYDLDPKNKVCIMALDMSKTHRRLAEGQMIQEQKQEGFLEAMTEVEKSAIYPFKNGSPIDFPDAKTWSELTKRRAQSADKGPYSEKELEIQRKLDQPVRLDYKQTPISTVLDDLANLTGVNIYKDPSGFAAAGVSSDTPITITLTDDIKLKNALKLILNPNDLTYVIQDEVLKITSKDMGKGQIYTRTYPVADLVIPIPNFVPTDNLGLAGAYKQALAQVNGTLGGGNGGIGSSIMAPATAVASRTGGKMNNDAVLANSMTDGFNAGSPMTPASTGPGAFGSGSGADFDSLIELIQKTVDPNTWEANAGPGSIAPFETNLSLVVSQTQEVHEKIVELLEQLRRLQDLQVTIEVRFISLSDSFYERVGVDFDVNIKSNADGIVEVTRTTTTDPDTGEVTETDQSNFKNSATVGLSAPGLFSSTLDIPVTQNSYGSTTPQFGGYAGAGDGLTMGMAFLSDIEAYLFVEAAQADSRSNIMQAPKVTLFNGQQAMVSDTQQSPFVISVTPVVGDFAAAQQPVIVVLSEGTFLTVQAVISNDRRFVRLTVVPFFSSIGDVNVFKFTGSTSTTEDTSSEGDSEQPATKKNSSSKQTTNSGTSVQLPTFAYQTVTTTVSVPDGGTVLLGGIKRLKEGRDEKGTPILNKIPYLNRLFQNVGIGRETESLMMMVTPRIIIQEEEEERMGVSL